MATEDLDLQQLLVYGGTSGAFVRDPRTGRIVPRVTQLPSLFDPGARPRALPPRFQPQVQPQMAPQPMQMQMQPQMHAQQVPPAQAAQGGPGGLDLGRIVGTIFAGADDPRLSPEQNNAIKKASLMRAGLAMMIGANDGNSSFLQTLALGAVHGQQARAGLAEQALVEARKQQVQRLLAQVPPDKYGAFVQLLVKNGMIEEAKEVAAIAKTMQPDTKVVNDALVDSSGNVIYRGGGDVSGEMQNVLFGMGIDPRTATQEQRAAALQKLQELKKAGATSVNVNPSGITRKGMAEAHNRMYDKAIETAGQASSLLEGLGVAKQLLAKGMPTGKGAELTLPVRQLLSEVGLADAKTVSEQQLFKSIANRLAVFARAGMPGALSDKNIRFLKEQSIQLSNTPEANRRIIELGERMAEHSQRVPELMDEYVDEHGSLAGWNAYSRQLFGGSDKDTVSAGVLGDVEVPAGSRTAAPQTQAQRFVTRVLNDPNLTQKQKREILAKMGGAR